jgi:hypothetical protein
VGTNQKYAEGWDAAFGGKGSKVSAAGNAPKKKAAPSKKAAAKKTAKKAKK